MRRLRTLIVTTAGAAGIVHGFAGPRIAGPVAHPATRAITPGAGLFSFPDVSRTRIVFLRANELWVVPRTGGEAVPLALSPGPKSAPKFSPDGRAIAFSANLEGSFDLYTVREEGAPPARVTHYPSAGKALCEWLPDGRLLYYTNSPYLRRVAQLYTVPATGGAPSEMPIPYGADGALSPDGRCLAYTPHYGDLIRTWKRYRGGMAPDIWLFNLRTHASRKITDWEGTDTLPMWHGETVYYLSDAGPGHRLNIWAYDTRDGSRKQITRCEDFDISNPSIGPGPDGQGEIVFQCAAGLYLLDLATGRSHAVEIRIPEERRQLEPRVVDAGKLIAGRGFSPTGDQAILEARGDLWIIPAVEGAPRNITRTSGVFERDPAWSPDGRWIACFSDASGEYELSIAPAHGTGETRQLTHLGPGFRYRPTWSPDSRRVAFTDNRGGLFIHTLDTGATKRIDTDPWAQRPDLGWSHDSSWLAYTRNGDNQLAALWLYNVPTGEKRQVTRGMFKDSSPAFDRKGDYLFFVSVRSIPAPTSDALDGTFVHTHVDALVAVPLRGEVGAPGDAGISGPAGMGTGARKEAGSTPRARGPLRIDLEGFEARAIVLPTPRGTLANLGVTGDGNPIFARVGPGGERSIRLLDLAAGKVEEKSVFEGEGDFQLSADGAKLLIRQGSAMAVLDAAPGAKITRGFGSAGMTVPIDPHHDTRAAFDGLANRSVTITVSHRPVLDADARRFVVQPVTSESLLRHRVGARTWGGLIGLRGSPSLIDGGYWNIPASAFFEEDGTWSIEGHGIEPDVAVAADPARMVNGGDPQLDAAIRLMLADVKHKSYRLPHRPAYPDRSRMGIRKEDR